MVLLQCEQIDVLLNLNENEMLYHKFHKQTLCQRALFDYGTVTFLLIKMIDDTADNNEYFYQLKNYKLNINLNLYFF